MFILLVFVFYGRRSACVRVVCQLSYILERGVACGGGKKKGFLIGFPTFFFFAAVIFVLGKWHNLCLLYFHISLLSLWVYTITGGETQSIIFVVWP